MKFLAPIAFAVLGSEVAALSLKTKTHHASHVAKTEVQSVHRHAHRSKALTRSPASHGKRYTNTEASLNLVAYLLMLAGNLVQNHSQGVGSLLSYLFGVTIPAINSTGDVAKAYDFIGIPGGIAFIIWAAIFTLDAVWVVWSFFDKGDANSGKDGRPNDLASFNSVNQWPIRTAFVLQGVWPIIQSLTKINYTGTPGAKGLYGVGRGSQLDLSNFDWAFWTNNALLLIIAGYFYHNSFMISKVFTNYGWTSKTMTVFAATFGLMLNAGWIVAASGFVPNIVTVALTKSDDVGNLSAQIVSLAIPIASFALLLMPVFFSGTLGSYAYAPAYFAVSWAFSWIAMRIYDIPEAELQWQTYLQSLYTSTNGLDYNTFRQTYVGIAISVAAFAGSMGLYYMIGDIPW